MADAHTQLTTMTIIDDPKTIAIEPITKGAFSNARKHGLTERGSLNTQIKRRVWANEISVRGYLTSEKRLCDEVFFGSLAREALNASLILSKDAVMQLLIFGDVDASPRQLEKLFRALDMYKFLVQLQPDMYVGNSIREEFYKVLKKLGDALRGLLAMT